MEKDLDLITIEIENVNTDALACPSGPGQKSYFPTRRYPPDSGTNNKMLFRDAGIPTSPFELVENRNDVQALFESGKMKLPARAQASKSRL
ncbi:MAG: hypothetical protein R3B47_19380 [Bacteroidia bacterium]